MFETPMLQLPMMNLLAQAGEDRIAAPRDEHVGSYWFSEQASSFANSIDFAFYAILWTSAIFFVIIITVMTYFAIKYRRRPGHQVEKSTSHNTALEIAWSVLPGFLLIWFFIEGANGFFQMRIPPGDAEEINVIASQFTFEFHYPDGDVSREIHLVRGRPVKFIMSSKDVLHALYIPSFRMKQDIVPGRYTVVWAKPIETGTFRVYCAEYCGDNHSNMVTNVTVHETEEDRKAATQWLWDLKSPIENGERIFQLKCLGCHNTTPRSDTSSQKTGPNMGGLWGTKERMDNGTMRPRDGELWDNYFRESLDNPNAAIVEGFARPSAMTPFKDQFSEEQIVWMKAYLKSLNPSFQEEETGDEDDEASSDSGAGDAESPEDVDGATGDDSGGDEGSDDDASSDDGGAADGADNSGDEDN